MTARPCLDCGKITTAGSRCQSCQSARERQRDEHRGTAAQRGYNWTWKRLRAQVLLEEPVCRECKAAPSVEVDHEIPRALGGTHDRANLRGLCHGCHAVKSARDKAAVAKASVRR